MSKEQERKELDYIIIRPYSPEDYDTFCRLHIENWPKSKSDKDFKIDDLFDRREQIFIAQNGSEIVGSFSYVPSLHHAYIRGLLVKTEYRRQGIAAEMLKFAEERAKRHNFPKITIVAGSEELISYYENLGFRRNPHTERGLVKDIGTK